MTAMKNNGNAPKARPARFKHKKLILVLSAFLLLVCMVTSSFVIASKLKGVLQAGRERLLNGLDYGAAALPDDYEYVYNRDVINILLIGVDKDSSEKSPVLSEQADALYLFSFDTQKKKANIIAISRNTLMDIDIYDMNHNLIARDEQQICTAYAYGRTRQESAELTVKAVSQFFYNIPISGYYAIYTDAVGEIVDSVGGVPIQVKENLTAVSYRWRKGANLVLKGNEALRYLRYRGESNEPRLERQKDFLQSFLSVAKTAVSRDLSLPVKLFRKLASRTVTNVDVRSVAYLASEAVDADFKLIGLKGQNGIDGSFETFTVDQEDLYQLLTDVFYKKNN